MSLLLNGVKMTTTTVGTGTLTLGEAVGPFNTFSAAAAVDQSTYSYRIEDVNGAWEVGWGLYTASGTTLTRNVDASSTGAILSLSGFATVVCTHRAADRSPYEAISPAPYPKATDFPTWFNQGSATLTSVANGVLMSAPQSAQAQVLKAAPSVPFSVYARIDSPVMTMAQFTSMGLTLFNNANNNSCRFWWSSRANSTAFMRSIMTERFASSAFSANWATIVYNNIALMKLPNWLRLDVTSTTITAFASTDGVNWINWGADTIASFLAAVPTHVGLVMAPAASPANTNYMVCSAFSFAAPVFGQ